FQVFTLESVDYDHYIWGERGVWGVRPGGDAVSGQLFAVRSFVGRNLTYQAFDSPATQTVMLPGPASVVMAVDPGGERILVADWSLVGDIITSARLYIPGADGSNRHLLY